MGTFEEENESGLEDSDIIQVWNTMHGFWIRLFVALRTTSVWWIMHVRMSVHGMTASMLWQSSGFIVLSAIASVSVLKQLLSDRRYSKDRTPLSEELLSGEFKPW